MNPQVKRRRKLAATDARNLRTLLLLSVFEPVDIGARIATARKEAGLTQEELADLVGVSTRSLQGYEAGEVVPYRHMARLSEVTRREVAWLLHGDDPTSAAPADLRRVVREEVASALAHVEELLERLADQAPPAPPEAGSSDR
jgi:transcriptional regulator with XRE-family HTH domain